MRFMILLKSSPSIESGPPPSEGMLAAMGHYNEELTNAGVLLVAEGLQPSANGARVKFEKGTKTVIDGPFTEAKELIAGFWILRCDSRDEAVEWAKRAPFPLDSGAELEVRRILEQDDFGEAFTPELREREKRLGEQMKGNATR